MSGSMTVACRFSNGEILVSEAHSRNGYDTYAYSSFFVGDDSGARAHLMKLKEFDMEQGDLTLREDEYGVLILDFCEMKLIMNRDTEKLTEHLIFLPSRYSFDRDAGLLGRVTMHCPEGTFEPFYIRPEMVDVWESLVDVPSARDEDMPLPARYYQRYPRPVFRTDFAPWSVVLFNEHHQRQEFWDAAQHIGFKVDREGWMDNFEDDDDDMGDLGS